jgi:hypothetical protein
VGASLQYIMSAKYQMKTFVVVIERLSTFKLPVIFFAKFCRIPVYYIDSSQKFLMGMCKILSIQQVDINALPTIERSKELFSFDDSRIVNILMKLRAPQIAVSAAEDFLDPLFSTKIFMSSLTGILERARQRYSAINSFTRELGYSKAVVITDSYWMKKIIRSYGDIAIVIRIDSLFRKKGLHLIGLLIQILVKKLKSVRVFRILRKKVKIDSEISKFGVSTSKVLFVPHQSNRYGNLYTTDHLFSPVKSSILHKSNMGIITYDDSSLEGFAKTVSLTSHLNPKEMRLIAEIYLRLFFIKFRYILNPVEWYVVRMSARAILCSKRISVEYPSAKIAILGYDIQVPDYLVLALDNSGIETVATLERPAIAVIREMALCCKTLFVPSEYFSLSINNSISCAVSELLPIGMWRTDFLVERLKSDAIIEVENRRLLCVVLPFHTPRFDSKSNIVDDFVISDLAHKHFLRDVIKLASIHPEIDFVIRGKDADWTALGSYSEIYKEILDSNNIEVSQNYEVLNESYNLCARADIIVGKHTSLIDEALSLNIPCVLHDYTHNTKSVIRGQITYLPRELWAENYAEFLFSFDLALSDRGDRFREWWEPHRIKIFGNFSDGHVRARAMSLIEGKLPNNL